MGTKIFGCSDDLVEVEGDVRGEHGDFNTSADQPVVLKASDGTELTIHYGKGGVWKIDIKKKGDLFDRLDICNDSEADPYSDVAHFRPGLTSVLVETADGWEEVR